MNLDYSVISIGTLSRNRLWGESAAVRTGHATTSVVFSEGRVILVDPSLPGAILGARFNERTGRALTDVTDVFCTTLRQVHRRGLADLDGATWWAGEVELLWYRDYLAGIIESDTRNDPEHADEARADLELLNKIKPLSEPFTPQVQAYPLPGPTPGTTGLLLTPATRTIVIASDAAVTAEHVSRGQVWEGCHDAEAAMDSLQDLIELADVIIPGHDNVIFLSRQWL